MGSVTPAAKAAPAKTAIITRAIKIFFIKISPPFLVNFCYPELQKDKKPDALSSFKERQPGCP